MAVLWSHWAAIIAYVCLACAQRASPCWFYPSAAVWGSLGEHFFTPQSILPLFPSLLFFFFFLIFIHTKRGLRGTLRFVSPLYLSREGFQPEPLLNSKSALKSYSPLTAPSVLSVLLIHEAGMSQWSHNDIQYSHFPSIYIEVKTGGRGWLRLLNTGTEWCRNRETMDIIGWEIYAHIETIWAEIEFCCLIISVVLWLHRHRAQCLIVQSQRACSPVIQNSGFNHVGDLLLN